MIRAQETLHDRRKRKAASAAFMRAHLRICDLRDGLLRKAEAAAFLKIHPRTLDEWQRQGKVAIYKFGMARNAAVRFCPKDLERLRLKLRRGCAK